MESYSHIAVAAVMTCGYIIIEYSIQYGTNIDGRFLF